MNENLTNTGNGSGSSRARISEEIKQSIAAEATGQSPDIQSVNVTLSRVMPDQKGTGFQVTVDNKVDANWLAQTPNVWGKSAGSVSVNAGAFILDDIADLISSAESFVDITTLVQFPDGEFMTTIQKALVDLMNSGAEVTVRILAGWYPAAGQITGALNQTEYLKALIEPLTGLTGNVQIYCGAQRTDATTWNHSKIIAVDGKKAIVGGENLWTDNYLGPEPVHDLNVMVEGDTVFYLHQFVDVIWKEVCGYTSASWQAKLWTGGTSIYDGCLATSLTEVPGSDGTIGILGAGRFGGSDITNNPADLAMYTCMTNAQETIYLSQQDIIQKHGPVKVYWNEGMEALANALVRGVKVYIVISNDDAKASSGTSEISKVNMPTPDMEELLGSDGTPYSVATLKSTADAIKSFVEDVPGAPTGAALDKLLCENLNLASLRFGPSDEWPNGFEFANHAKFMMVDESIFSVSSMNFYPADLIEYGMFFSDPDMIQNIKENYWDQLWKYSSRTAISGEAATSCYFS